MSAVAVRGLLAGASVVVATAAGIVTNVATDQPSLAWWVALGSLVILGVATQVSLTLFESHSPSATAAGAGSIAVGGSTHRSVTTRVREGMDSQSRPSTPNGTSAMGPGSIAIGGEARGDLSTEVGEGRGAIGP